MFNVFMSTVVGNCALASHNCCSRKNTFVFSPDWHSGAGLPGPIAHTNAQPLVTHHCRNKLPDTTATFFPNGTAVIEKAGVKVNLLKAGDRIVAYSRHQVQLNKASDDCLSLISYKEGHHYRGSITALQLNANGTIISSNVDGSTGQFPGAPLEKGPLKKGTRHDL